MNFRDLLEDYHRLQDQVWEMRREIAIRNRSTWDEELLRVEQEQREHLEARRSSLIGTSEAYQQTQESILRRICGPNEPLVETRSASGFGHVKPSAPLEKPNQDSEARRNLGAPRMASRLDRFPLRRRDGVEFEMEVEAMQAHIQQEAEIAAYNARAIGRIVSSPESSPRDSSSPVDASTPEELRGLLVLQMPELPPKPAPPATQSRTTHSRIPRLKPSTETTKARNDGSNTPANRYEVISQMRALTKKLDVPLQSAASMIQDRARLRTGEDSTHQRPGRMAVQRSAGVPSKRSQAGRFGGSSQRKGTADASAHKDSEGRGPEEQNEVQDRVVLSGRRGTREDLGLVKEEPLDRPELALNQVFQLLQLEDWERKVEGLTVVRALAEHHADVILPKLHEVCLATIQEVRNLRSMVSRAAMSTLAHLYAHLPRAMDPELDGTALVLLQKSGETSRFAKQDVEKALDAMVMSCSPARVLNALLAGGLSHRNAAVRRCLAVQLEKFAAVVGASHILHGRKSLAGPFLSSISRLAHDAAQDVRFHARNAIRSLAAHQDFIKLVDKFVTGKDRACVTAVLTKAR